MNDNILKFFPTDGCPHVQIEFIKIFVVLP